MQDSQTWTGVFIVLAMFAPALAVAIIDNITNHHFPLTESIMNNLKYLAHRLRHPQTTIHPDKINWDGSRDFGMKFAFHFRRFRRPMLLMWDTNVHHLECVTYKNPADTFAEFMMLHSEFIDYCQAVAQGYLDEAELVKETQ